MAAPRIKWNLKAFKDIRTSAEVRKELDRRAKAIANGCGDGFESDTDITGGRGRARSAVWPATAKAARKNASENTLLRNLDRGRG